jgi:hypothetical protein
MTTNSELKTHLCLSDSLNSRSTSTLQRIITEAEQNNGTRHIQLLRRSVDRARKSTQNANITWVNKERNFAASEMELSPLQLEDNPLSAA